MVIHLLFLYTGVGGFLAVAYGACENQVVGPDCAFQCHCLNSTEQCNGTSGACLSGCDYNWAGPACQHKNYARANTARTKHSDNSGQQWANQSTDGNGNTCSQTQYKNSSDTTDSWWKVWLGEGANRRVRGLSIKTSHPDLLRGFIVYVSTAVNQSEKTGLVLPGELHVCHNGTAGVVAEMDVECDDILLGDLIIILVPSTYRPAQIDLCEVAVYGECEAGRYGDSCLNKCGHCCGGTRICDNISGECSGATCDAGWHGSRCDEVCPDGYWGNNCTETCGGCADATCNPVNGLCSSRGCQPGYKNTPHCVEVCPDGSWGHNCSWTCGRCAKGTCNHTNGNCSSLGCQPGYTNTSLCVEVCSGGSWGQGCTWTCGRCAEGTCNRKNGHCSPLGCHPGYKNMSLCQEVCDDGMYGLNCQFECGQCGGVTSCDNADGACIGSCESNWHGLLCQAYKELEGTSLAVGIGVGLAATIVAGVTVFFIVIIFYRRRRRSQKEIEEESQFNSNTNVDSTHFGVNENVCVVADGHATGATRANGDTATYANCIVLQDLESDPGKHHIISKPLKSVPHRKPCPVEYGNICTRKIASAVDLVDFRQYIYEHASQDGFTKEYSELPLGLQSPTVTALLPSNKSKNRYKNMYPYDYNRVVLKLLHGQPNSDYINASYINGYGKERAFIAAQGPTKNNINDFLRMIWEVDIKTIVMLTECIEGGTQKCLQYWPNEGETMFDRITVSMVSEEIFADFTIRTIAMNTGHADRRTIQHYQFTTWPDKAVPSEPYGLIQFHSKVKTSICSHEHPVLVHCSAGVGRTGTFLAYDYLYEEGRANGYVDVLPCVKELRRQRILMVQTEVQYKFLHEILYGALVSASSAIAVDDFPSMYTKLGQMDGTTGKTKLATMFQNLRENELRIPDNVAAKTEASKTDEFKTARMPENMKKNRDRRILASEKFRPDLSTPVDGCNNYINAVYIQTYRNSKGLIITQLPLAHTAVDFCRLIHELEVELVVTFADTDMLQKDTWLSGSTSEHGPFMVTSGATSDEKHFTTRDIDMIYSKTNSTTNLKQYISTKFQPSGPTDCEALIDLLMSVSEEARRRHDNKPVIIQCMNGCDQSGVFCILWNVFERMRMDNEISIPQTISQARFRHRQLITNCEQFKICHDVILHYIDNYLVYCNM